MTITIFMDIYGEESSHIGDILKVFLRFVVPLYIERKSADILQAPGGLYNNYILLTISTGTQAISGNIPEFDLSF